MNRCQVHSTTTKRTHYGRKVVRTDPHLTVFTSNSPDYYEHEGHLYVIVKKGVPIRLAKVEELAHVDRDRSNPQLWEYKTPKLVKWEILAA